MPQMDDSRPLSILLVEDHDAFALTLATVLGTDPRLEVVDRAADGRAGIDLAVRHQPDVVLMDIYMPNVDGIEATREITGLLPDTVVVVLSSSDADDDVTRALAAGARGFLPKDASLQELVATILEQSARAAEERRRRRLRPAWRPRFARRLCL